MFTWDVYLSSSWKNRDRVRAMANALRERGLKVYDFTDPSCRNVPEIPPEKYPAQFDPTQHVYSHYIGSVPEWRAAIMCNKDALANCKTVILLLPCGSDAHADWAYGLGCGAKTVVTGAPKAGDRVPTHMWSDAIVDTDAQAIDWCVKTCRGAP
jgi:hypothetical protein